VLESLKGYWNVISHDGEAENLVTDFQKWLIHLKCQYMYCALHSAKEKMPTIQNWDKCCQSAREMMLLTGVRIGRCSRTIQNWYLDFTKRDRIFDVRIPSKHNLPSFFDENRNEIQQIREYIKENLHTLSIEMLSEYIHYTIIPHLVKEQFQVDATEGERYEKAVKDLLQQHGFGKICPSTIYHWLKLLGFKYEPRQKGYYVDGHEKPSTVEY
jgi:hypothetical protein